jgi:ParB family chromosome partitioning protein
MNDFELAPIERVYESRTNPRTFFDADKLADLANNVKEHGVLVPLLVRRNGQPDKLEVIDGARRFRAAKKAGVTTLPVRICEMSDQKVLEVQVIANLQREDVHEMDEALGYQRLLDLRNEKGEKVHNAESLAAAVGKSASYIYQRVKLAALEKPIQKAFYAGQITAGHAIQLARLQAEDQAAMFKQIGDRWQGTISVRELGNLIQREVHMVLSGAPWKKEDATLVPAAGSCVDCPKRTGHQRGLFPDVEKDTCTDRACYAAKLTAFVDLQVATIKARDGSPPLRISTHYRNTYRLKPQAGVVYQEQYSELRLNEKKLCDGMRNAVVIDGAEAGHVKKVCADAKCKVHRPSYSRAESAGEQIARQRKMEKARIEADIEKRVVEAVLEKVKYSLFGRADLVGFAQRLFEEMHQDTRKKACAWLGIEGVKTEVRRLRSDEAPRRMPPRSDAGPRGAGARNPHADTRSLLPRRGSSETHEGDRLALEG